LKKIKRVLVTGGAGFIGSFIVDELVRKRYQVVVLDNLVDQVHKGMKPKYLNKSVKFILGDVTNTADLRKAIKNVDAIYHEASAVGVGQSMYQIDHYFNTNVQGTAKLLDFLANNKHNVKHLIVASSMSAYGEGLYECQKCGLVRPPLRGSTQMKKKDWELHCQSCNRYLAPVPTPETEKFASNSIYALTKQTQEEMMLIFGRAYNIPATAFRYFNVYGPRQSLSNPYTGVAAIFLSRLKNNQSPVIYEDGEQTRDFVSVYDIARANVLALGNPKSYHQVFNLGGGKGVAIGDVALMLAEILKVKIIPDITEQFRSGDVRHCFADIKKAKKLLGWSPDIKLKEGIKNLVEWSKEENAEDKFSFAVDELRKRGITT